MQPFESPKFIEEKVILSLKMTRKGRNLTQRDLAKRMNVSRDTIARLESGRSRVTLGHVISIARILDVSLDKILSEIESQNPLDSSLNKVGNSSSTYLLNDFAENLNVVYYTDNQNGTSPNESAPQLPVKQKINPFLTMDAVEHYGAEMKTFILTHKSLWWWTAEKELVHLSIASVVEAILNFGGDEDIARLFKLVSMEKVSEIFKAANLGSRTNYQPEVITYFESYFKRHVSGYSN